MKLPRPYKVEKVELKKPDSDTILNVYEKSEQGKIYSAMLHVLEGGIVKPVELREMPLVSAEVCVTEIFKLYGIETKVENIHTCERCFHKIKHEKTKEHDTRDDIGKIKIKYSSDTTPYELKLPKGNEIIIRNDDKIVAEIHTLFFRDPTIGDMISLQSDNTLKQSSRILKKLYFNCLVDLDGNINDPELDSDIESMKNKFMYELLSFPDIRDFNRIGRLMRTYGYKPDIELVCPECDKEFESRIEWTGFFGYALRSTAKAGGK